MAEAIDLPFRLWTRVGRRKHKFNRIRQEAPVCPYRRAQWRTWRIRLNRPSAAAMRPYVKLLLPLVKDPYGPCCALLSLHRAFTPRLKLTCFTLPSHLRLPYSTRAAFPDISPDLLYSTVFASSSSLFIFSVTVCCGRLSCLSVILSVHVCVLYHIVLCHRRSWSSTERNSRWSVILK